jgi:hypothetical protein
MSNCTGNGECLTQTINENTYGQSPDYSCEHKCKPIPCCNELVCGSQLPPWFHGLKKVGLCICIGCDSTFGGKLDTVETTDCPVCLETKPGVVMPRCTHSMCVGCFKRCMYGEPDEPEPKFPYSEDVENEWHEDQDSAEFLARYPLVVKYNQDWNSWDDRRQVKYEKEENLRHCPYCRS